MISRYLELSLVIKASYVAGACLHVTFVAIPHNFPIRSFFIPISERPLKVGKTAFAITVAKSNLS